MDNANLDTYIFGGMRVEDTYFAMQVDPPLATLPLGTSKAKPRFDKRGNKLRSIGLLFREDLYFEYKKLALLKRTNTYDLVNEAMAHYLPELNESVVK